MYEVLNSNGVRTEAEVLNMLLDNEHGVSLSHVMGKLNLEANQARNCIARLEYIPASNPKQYYVIDRLKKRVTQLGQQEEMFGNSNDVGIGCNGDRWRVGDHVEYEGGLRLNYTTEIYKLTTDEG